MGVRLRVLAGKDVVKILKGFGFGVIDQSGSHVKVRRVMAGMNQTLIIPNHDPIAKGTLRAIFTQSTKYVSQIELLPLFYN